MSASIGLALYPLDGEDAESLIKNAGAAMHFAKDQGRDNYQFYSRAMNATALEKLSLESQLRKALERDELLLYFQPKISATTGAVAGVEALIRWKHPELGMVPPSQFIPVAEETGLIVADRRLGAGDGVPAEPRLAEGRLSAGARGGQHRQPALPPGRR